MNLTPLLGIIAIIYAGMILYIAVKRPKNIWNMGKIKFLKRALGEKGTIIFLYIWAVVFIGLGVWLISN